ncbi:MAG: hypothetical protein ABH871_06710 [Pseudomonadota bacterium]
MLIGFVLFGFLGIATAIVISAFKRSIASKKLELTGEVSLVLFPIFGLIIILYPLVAVRVSELPWYGRGVVYMIVFFIVQYLVGLLLTKLNKCPWNYSGKGSFGGLVHISDAPYWFITGLGIEHVYPWVKATAVALG